MKLNLKCFVLVGAWALASSLCAAERTQIYHIMVPKSLDAAEKLMAKGFAEGGDGVCLDLCKLDAGVRTEESFRRLVKHAAGHPIYFCLYKWDPILKGDDAARMEVLKTAAKAGAAIIDMPADLYNASPRELTRDPAAIERQRKMAEELHRLGVKVIVSSHMKENLKASEILEHFQRQAEHGADIVKIVHKVDTDAELAETERAMRELQKSFPKPWLLLANGKKGREVRLLGCDYGCAIEFAVTDGDTRETFKEQPTIRELRKRIGARKKMPFLDGYSLNEGRQIAFTQALPRMRNAETGKSCGMFNNKDLAIPGILTTRDPSFGDFLHRLRNVINDERALVFVDGRTFMVNKNWIRDHVHTLKAMHHWEYDYAGYVDFTIEQQRADGCILELIKQADDQHWKYAAPESRKFFPDDNLAMCRLDIEADVEYLLVEGATYCYRVSGDDAWLARVLPRLEKAIDYMTSDPQRWEPKYGLVKRGYTIDTWDFTYLPSAGTNRMLTAETPQAIMHGDNSGVFQAMNQLAWFNARLGRSEKAKSWRARADVLKANMYRHLWNGTFFIHELPLNVPPVDAHERERLSLSAAYDMNRGLMPVADCRKTIEEFLRRRQTTACFAEWFTVDPPYDFSFCRHGPGDYVNGGICLFTAGELAKAALENGYEAYGWDILTRVKAMAERDDALYFLYDRKTAKSINARLGPSAWGAASILSAFDEALAGVRDTGVKYESIRFSPRWPVTGLDEVRYFTGYEAVLAVVDVRYVLRPNGMRYRVQSPAKNLDAHILLPKGTAVGKVLVNGTDQAFTVSTIGESVYVDFIRTGTGLYDIEILFR